jgi:hypothetical protein
MKPARPSRVRRTLKGAGLVLCLLLLIAIAASFRWGMGYVFPWSPNAHYGSNGFSLCYGAIDCTWCHDFIPEPPYLAGVTTNEWSSTRYGFQPKGGWLSHILCPRVKTWHYSQSSFVVQLHIPLTPVIIVLAAATAFLWYRDRGVRLGDCSNCGYNLTGNVSGICPECGAAIEQPGTGAQRGRHHSGV